MSVIDKQRYPIGRFNPPAEITTEYIDACIDRLEAFPEKLRKALEDLTPTQLDQPYRPEGWSVRQLVHHIADSHLNSYIRFKWTLTEDSPTIKAYDQDAWAELSESRSAPVEWSVLLLEGLHKRWVHLLKGLSTEEFNRYFIHPEHGRHVSLAKNVALYAWHGDHHLAHILLFKENLESEGK